MEKCQICKNQDNLFTFFLGFSRSIKVCKSCKDLIERKMKSVQIKDMLSSLAVTTQWIKDYSDNPKMILSFNNRLRELSEELWIKLNSIN